MKIFGMGWVELLIILVVILLIFGPKNLPKLGSAFGKTVKNLREGLGSAKKSVKSGKDDGTQVVVESVDAPIAGAAPADAAAAAVAPVETAAAPQAAAQAVPAAEPAQAATVAAASVAEVAAASAAPVAEASAADVAVAQEAPRVIKRVVRKAGQ